MQQNAANLKLELGESARLTDLLKELSELYGLQETSALLQKVPDYAKDIVRRVEDGRVASITAADYMGRLLQLVEEPCVAELNVFLPEQQQQLVNDLKQLQHEFLEQSLASQMARRQAARATLGLTPPPAAAAAGEHPRETPGSTLKQQQTTRQQTTRPKKRAASSDEELTDDSDIDLDDDGHLPAADEDYSPPRKLTAAGKRLLTGRRAAQLAAAATTAMLSPVPLSIFPAAAAAPSAASLENDTAAAAAAAAAACAGADHSRPEGTGPNTAEPAAAARLDPATFSLEDLDQLIRQMVQQGVLNIQRPAEKWVGVIKPLAQLAPGHGTAERPMQGVLLSALPQHLQTIPDSWTGGKALISGRTMNSRSARDYCDRLRSLLTRVPEVVEVLGQDQVETMLKQIQATSAQLSGKQPGKRADRRAAATAAAAAAVPATATATATATAIGAQQAAGTGSLGSLGALLASAAGDTAANTARAVNADMGAAAAAAAAGDAGVGGDAAGDISDMQLDADPSEPPTAAAPAPAPSTSAAVAAAHPTPAASPAAGAAAAPPDPATFDLEQLYQLIKQRVEQGVLQDKNAAEKWMKPIGPLPRLVTGDLDRQGVLLSTLPQHLQAILDGWVTGKTVKAGRPVSVTTAKTYCSLMTSLLTRVPEVVVVLGQDQVKAMLKQIEATYEKLCGKPPRRPTAAATAAARLQATATAAAAGAAAVPAPAAVPVVTAATTDTHTAADASAGAAAGPAPTPGTVTAPAAETHTAVAPAPGGGAGSDMPGSLAATAAGQTAGANAAGTLSHSMAAAAAGDVGDVDAEGDGGAEASGDTVNLQQDASPTEEPPAAAAGAEDQGGVAHHQADTVPALGAAPVAHNIASPSAPPAGSTSAAASPVPPAPPAAHPAPPQQVPAEPPTTAAGALAPAAAAAALEQASLAQAEEVLLGLCSDSDTIISMSDAVEALRALPGGDARLTMFWRDYKFIARALQMGATTEAVQILFNKLMKHVLQ